MAWANPIPGDWPPGLQSAIDTIISSSGNQGGREFVDILSRNHPNPDAWMDAIGEHWSLFEPLLLEIEAHAEGIDPRFHRRFLLQGSRSAIDKMCGILSDRLYLFDDPCFLFESRKHPQSIVAMDIARDIRRSLIIADVLSDYGATAAAPQIEMLLAKFAQAPCGSLLTSEFHGHPAEHLSRALDRLFSPASPWILEYGLDGDISFHRNSDDIEELAIKSQRRTGDRSHWHSLKLAPMEVDGLIESIAASRKKCGPDTGHLLFPNAHLRIAFRDGIVAHLDVYEESKIIYSDDARFIESYTQLVNEDLAAMLYALADSGKPGQ